MSGHDWNSDADHHDAEGQEAALSHHVDYGQATPSEPAAETVETADSGTPSEPTGSEPAGRSKSRLNLKGNPLKQIPKVKRETRVGVAAMLSFVILVTAFIVNKNRNAGKAAADKAKGAAAPVVAIKYEPDEPKVVKAPPRELEGDDSNQEELSTPTPPESPPAATSGSKDLDHKAIVLASADGPPPLPDTKPVNDAPKNEVLPPPTSEPPPTAPIPDASKPTTPDEKKDGLPSLPPSVSPALPEPPKGDTGAPLPPIQELKPPDEKAAAAPSDVPEVKDTTPKEPPAVVPPPSAAPPSVAPPTTPDSKSPAPPELPALPKDTGAPPPPTEPKQPAPSAEGPKPPDSGKPAPDPAKPAQSDGPPALNVIEPTAPAPAPAANGGPPAVLPVLPLTPGPLDQKPASKTEEPPKAAAAPEPPKSNAPAASPSPAGSAPPASEVLPPSDPPKASNPEPAPSPFPNTPAPREITSTPSPFDASQPRTITSIPQSEAMPSATTSAPAPKATSMPLEPGWTTLKKVGKSSIGGQADAEPLSTRQAIPDNPPPREDRVPKDDIEPVLHTVQRGENFWTVSRLYYGSGRYYRALWSYNRGKVPDIKELYVGTTIKVPPPEMLDRSLVESPSMASAAGSAPQPRTRPTPSPRSAPSDAEVRTVPMSRSRNDSRPDLSLGNPVSRAGREDVDAPTRPVYRIRANDTLRGIAKQTLGDAKRDREILELNRGLIDDPRRLTPGQTIILPSDANVTSRGR